MACVVMLLLLLLVVKKKIPRDIISALYQVLGEQVLVSSSDTQLLASCFLEDF
jgi:hypothetical protein